MAAGEPRYKQGLEPGTAEWVDRRRRNVAASAEEKGEILANIF